MKAGVLAIAAAIAAGVNANSDHAGRRHAHQAFHLERNLLSTATPDNATCGCTTIYSTYYGEATLYHPPPPPPTSTPAPPPPPPSTTAYPTSTPAPVVPTPYVATCPTTGVYTFPATIITLTETTTVCGAATTHVPSGTHTAGGVTTVVETSTTVVCPYATTIPGSDEGVYTSTILTTTYVCPSAGTYTIAPLTTTVTKSTVWVYPTPVSYPAGTYTQDAVVTTVTETDYVFICPFTSKAPAPAPKPTSYAAAPPPAPAPTYAAAPPPAAAPSTPAAPAHNSGGALPGGHLGSSGDQWAITYTPYTDAGLCKTEAEVYQDVTMIKDAGFTVLRVYSTDCSALKYIGNACAAAEIKMILGVFISKDQGGIPGAQQQVSEIVAWAKWSLVDMIIVGNEAVVSNTCTAGELAGFITSSAAAFAGAGYTGPISTAEPLNIWQQYGDVLCPVIDVLGCNIHAFFNAETVAEKAGYFVKGQLDIADKICPGKYAINTETGWPSEGTGCNGLACPGVQQQADAVKNIKDVIGGKSVMFSFKNDLWKDPGAFGCERSWGLLHLYGY